MLCSLGVISPPSLLLSLHYLSGDLSAVLYMLSCATIEMVTFPSARIVKCSQECVAASFLCFCLYPVMNNNCEFAAWFSELCSPWFIFFIPRPFKCFTAFVSDAYTYFSSLLNTFCSAGMCLFPRLRLQFVSNIRVYVCLHGCKWALLHLPESMVWSTADGCLLPKRCDSWRKLELRAHARIGEEGRGGRAREVITIKPLQREHPSASFPPLAVWHRCKMPPRLIYRAARALNKFVLKFAVKQNQLFCIYMARYERKPL